MKRVNILLITCLMGFVTQAQNITGAWEGVLNVQGTSLRLVFHFDSANKETNGTMDSPDQNALGIPITSITFHDSILKIEISDLKIEYQGILRNNIISGIFKQAGYAFNLDLSREKLQNQVKRPQEPAKPYPYYSEDLFFNNREANITLSGTLTLPKKEGAYPAVILISGSGPQNRDEELFGHKPFLVLADFLTKNGIAVLRFDDRGIANSTGDFSSATTSDFASDVKAAIDYLRTRKEIDKNRIGLIGHSEGGTVAAIVAANWHNSVSFIVLLAAPGLPGDQLLLQQQRAIATAMGQSPENIKKIWETNKKAFDIVKKSTTGEQLRTDLKSYITETVKNTGYKPQGISEEKYIQLQMDNLLNPWMIQFIKYDPAADLENVQCPILALGGEKDLQVLAKPNLNAILLAAKKGKNTNVKIEELPGLNHLFQTCSTGLPDEYEKIQETCSPVVLNEILRWITQQHKQ